MKQNVFLKKGVIKGLLSVLLIISVVLANLSISNDIFADSNPSTGNDVTGLLTSNTTVTLFQNGVDLQEGAQVDPEKPFLLEGNFKVPVQLDHPADVTQIVNKDDFADIVIAEGITLTDSKWMNLLFADGGKTYKVGEAQFHVKEGEKKVRLQVIFTGNQNVHVNDPSVTYENEDVFQTHQNISVNFRAAFDLDTSNLPPNQESNTSVTILNKTYNFKVLETAHTVRMEKSGKVIHDDSTGRFIEWAVKLDTDKVGDVFDGYTFKDDLTNVGEFVSGSFKVKYGPENSPATFAPNVDYTNHLLSYTFASDAGNSIAKPVFVTFRTKITEEEFRAKKKLTKTNTAQIFKGDKLKAEASAKVEWNPIWIRKDVDISQTTKKTYEVENGDYFITWKLTLNENRAKLKNVVIRDFLIKEHPYTQDDLYELDFVSATLEKYDASNNKIGTEIFKADNPGSGEKAITTTTTSGYTDRKHADFVVGDLEGQAILKIRTKVRKDLAIEEEDFLSTDRHFKNYAEMRWDGVENIPAFDHATTTIGDRSVTKQEEADGIFTKAKITSKSSSERVYLKTDVKWKVVVKKGNINENTKVYDMIIHDTSVTKDIITTKGLSLDAQGNVKEIDGVGLEKLIPIHVGNHLIRYAKFKPGTLKNGDNTGETKEHPLYYGSKIVGYLLEVKGKTGEKNITFTFETAIADPALLVNNTEDFLVNADTQAPNTVYLVQNGKIETGHTCWTRYISRVLEKEALSADDVKLFLENANADHANRGIGTLYTDESGKKKTQDNAFNHNSRSVVYRLSVNAAGIKDMGDLVVKDTLPEGWELKKYTIFEGEGAVKPNLNLITNEKDLEKQIFAGVKALGTAVLTGNQSNDALNVKVEYTEPSSGPKTILFTFKDIDKPYVILLEAAPDEHTMLQYLKDFKNDDVKNSAELYLENFPNYKVTKEKPIKVNVRAIGKEYKYDDNDPGVLEWHVDYTPYDLIKNEPPKEVKIEDILKKGIDIRLNNDGSLAFTDEGAVKNFRIVPLTLNADGTKTEGAELDSIQNFISYREGTEKVLTFKIPELDKAYRFYYLTDLTGKALSDVENTVKLTAKDVEVTYEPPTKHRISEADVKAFGRRAVKLEILKVDSEDASILLKDAQFRLENDTGTPSYSKVFSSDAQGKAVLKGIPEGVYKLTEIAPPSGYKANSKSYRVEVSRNGDQSVVKVDGKTGVFTVKNEKQSVLPPGATDTASLEIKKTDSHNKTIVLKGAEFVLRASDGSERRFESDQNGMAKLDNISVGEYTLVETKAPSGYILDNRQYSVKVSKEGQQMVLTVDGNTGVFEIGNTIEENKPNIIEPNNDDNNKTTEITEKKNDPGNHSPDQTPSESTPPNPDTEALTPDIQESPDEPEEIPEDTEPDDEGTPPTFSVNDLPDPNNPESPERIIVVDEDGLPLGIYEKQEKPDGTHEYILIDDHIPLEIPKTGYSYTSLYATLAFVLILTVFGMMKDKRQKNGEK